MATPKTTVPSLHRQAIDAILKKAVAAVDPYDAVHNAVRVAGDTLHVQDAGGLQTTIDLSAFTRIVVVGAGKATGPMAQAIEEMIGPRLDAGLIVVKDGHDVPLQRVKILQASHPVPDYRGQQGALDVLSMVEAAAEDTLVLVLLSGGASALWPAPRPGISLEEKQEVSRALLAAGAPIEAINTVRKRLSAIKGGRLALSAFPATVITLTISDVVGDDPAVIGSGPTAPDPAAMQDTPAILQRYDLYDRLPTSVLEILGETIQTRDDTLAAPDHPAFRRCTQAIIANNRMALRACEAEAQRLGWQTLRLTSSFTGEAREAGGFLASVAREMVQSGHPLAPPACVMAGGETTVTLRGSGKGGRNQELALAAALGIAGLPADVSIVGFGTDGTDGPTDAAGAIASGDTLDRANAKGLDPVGSLTNNDSYRFFDSLGDLIRTGPTRTNVMDLYLVFLGQPDKNRFVQP